MPTHRGSIKKEVNAAACKQSLCTAAALSEKKAFPRSSSSSAGVAFLVCQMLFCLLGINVCFGWWSIKQERVIKKPYLVGVHDASSADGTAQSAAAAQHMEEQFLATTYGITLMQTFTGFLVSAVLLGSYKVVRAVQERIGVPQDAAVALATEAARERARSRSRLTQEDVPELLAMGFSNLLGSSLGYAAMRRLSFPVTLTAKMAKMLPVMLVGSVWYRTRYPLRKVVSCLLITLGVVSFALLDQSSAPTTQKKAKASAGASSSLFGMGLMIVNLLMDGYTSSTQDVLVKRHRWGGLTLMMWTNLVSVLCAAAVLVTLEGGEEPWRWLCTLVEQVVMSVSEEGEETHLRVRESLSTALAMVPFRDFSHFVRFLVKCPEARNDVLLMSMLNALGQLFIFKTISVFGTLALTAMTLLRKVGSVLLSIYVHGHHVQPTQWTALTLVLAGVVSEGYLNVQDAAARQTTPAASPATASPPPPSAPSAAADKAGPSTLVHSTTCLPSVTQQQQQQQQQQRQAAPSSMCSSSSSTAMLSESRSATPVCATLPLSDGGTRGVQVASLLQPSAQGERSDGVRLDADGACEAPLPALKEVTGVTQRAARASATLSSSRARGKRKDIS